MADDMTLEQRMVAAYAEMTNPPLDGDNPHFRSKFATLKAVMAAVRPAVVKHGMLYDFVSVRNDDGTYTLESRLTDGRQTMTLSQLSVPQVSNPQDLGKHLTYYKRQMAQDDWGLVGEEDDDGEGASNPQPRLREKPSTNPQPPSSEPSIDQQQWHTLVGTFERAVQASGADRNELWGQLCHMYQVSEGMGQRAYEGAVKWLLGRIPQE